MSETTVESYIASFQGITRQRLKQMRQIIKDVAPYAIESIAYGMPAYKFNSKPLVYFAGYKNHIGFYATPNGHEQFKSGFAKYKQGKGSVQFLHDQPLPLDLVKSVVEFRVKQLASSKKGQ